MAGFVADQEIDPLDFDFTKYDGPKGTIAEPSHEAVERFFREMSRMDGEMVNVRRQSLDAIREDGDPVEAAVAAFDTGAELSQKQLEAIAELCGGSPSLEDLRKLPDRVQKAFAGWLIGQFTNPQSTTATRPSLAVVKGA